MGEIHPHGYVASRQRPAQRALMRPAMRPESPKGGRRVSLGGVGPGDASAFGVPQPLVAAVGRRMDAQFGRGLGPGGGAQRGAAQLVLDATARPVPARPHTIDFPAKQRCDALINRESDRSLTWLASRIRFRSGRARGRSRGSRAVSDRPLHTSRARATTERLHHSYHA